MTTYERRQMILRMLQENAGVKVTELARQLEVSEGTIRNDLEALDKERQLVRVRGGAVARDQNLIPGYTISARARVNMDSKRRIAQWAAGMVESGDSILLDASTTVLHMASFLKDRQNLTVVTNGLAVARLLAENPTNTVILLGGILKNDGTAVVGSLSDHILKELHIQSAFVSAAGFSIEAGLMENDMQEAQLKSLMIKAAGRTIALVDTSKFGKLRLSPFAVLKNIDHIVTDNEVPPQVADQLSRASIHLTICSETTVTTYPPHIENQTYYTIGFANMSEEMPFGRDVRRSLEIAAKHANNIHLVVADNQLSGDVALEVAEDLIARQVDLVIEYQIDEKVGNIIAHKFNQADIPVISVDIPMVGATFFGVDNYKTGYIAGVALAEQVQKEWNGQFDHLIVMEHPRAGPLVAARIQGQLDGFLEVIPNVQESEMIFVDCGNNLQISSEVMLHLLESLPAARRLPVICFNDEATLGAIYAARKLNREPDLLLSGQGADRLVRKEIIRPHSRLVGAAAYKPEKYGEKLIEIALKILKGEPVPPAIYVEHTFLNADNIALYYPDVLNER